MRAAGKGGARGRGRPERGVHEEGAGSEGGVGGARGGELLCSVRGEERGKERRKEKGKWEKEKEKEKEGREKKKEREMERFAPPSRRLVGHVCAVGRGARVEGEQGGGFRCRGRVFRRLGDQAEKWFELNDEKLLKPF